VITVVKRYRRTDRQPNISVASPHYAKHRVVKIKRQNTDIADIIGIADIVSQNTDILPI